jgi:hypothetical protein
MLAIMAAIGGCGEPSHHGPAAEHSTRDHRTTSGARPRDNPTTTVTVTKPVGSSEPDCLPASAHAKNLPTCK